MRARKPGCRLGISTAPRRWYAEKRGLEPSEEREGGLRYVCADGVFCVFASTGSWDGTFVQMGFTVEDTEATMAELRSRSIVSRSTAFPGCRWSTASSTSPAIIRATYVRRVETLLRERGMI